MSDARTGSLENPPKASDPPERSTDCSSATGQVHPHEAFPSFRGLLPDRVCRVTGRHPTATARRAGPNCFERPENPFVPPAGVSIADPACVTLPAKADPLVRIESFLTVRAAAESP